MRWVAGTAPDLPDLKAGYLTKESLHVKINRDDPVRLRATEGKEE